MSSSPWQLEEVACDWRGARDADVLLHGRDRAHGLPGEFTVEGEEAAVPCATRSPSGRG